MAMERSRLGLVVVLAWLSVSAGRPQEQREIRTVLDVRKGMPRDKVLDALREKYTLVPPRNSNQLDVWTLRPSGSFRGGTVAFLDDKVVAVEILRIPAARSESARFAEEFFRLLYDQATPRGNPSDLEKALNLRDSTAEIEFHDWHLAGKERLEMVIATNGTQFNLTISKSEGLPPVVDVTQVIQ